MPYFLALLIFFLFFFFTESWIIGLGISSVEFLWGPGWNCSPPACCLGEPPTWDHFKFNDHLRFSNLTGGRLLEWKSTWRSACVINAQGKFFCLIFLSHCLQLGSSSRCKFLAVYSWVISSFFLGIFGVLVLCRSPSRHSTWIGPNLYLLSPKLCAAIRVESQGHQSSSETLGLIQLWCSLYLFEFLL